MLGVPRSRLRFASVHDAAFGVGRLRRSAASHRKAAGAARGGNCRNDAVCSFIGICCALWLHREEQAQPQAKTHEEGSGPTAPAGTLQSCPSSAALASQLPSALHRPKDCALTLRSSRRAPAGRFRPSCHSRPYAPCRHARLNSNVRPHQKRRVRQVRQSSVRGANSRKNRVRQGRASAAMGGIEVPLHQPSSSNGL